MAAPASQLTDKTFDVLEALVALDEASLPQLQARCDIPMTTAHRILQSLVRRGYAMRAGRGRYRPGLMVIGLAAGLSFNRLLAAAARPHLHRLSKKLRAHAHLGIWEDGMVTYLVKRPYGRTRVHSAEGKQLEAYCSAIGKILLSGLPGGDAAHYIAEGDFVPLTPNTIVDPERLADEIAAVRRRGWSTDAEEIAIGLRCFAVPLRDRAERIVAALSVSFVSDAAAGSDPTMLLAELAATAEAIGRDLYPAAPAAPLNTKAASGSRSGREAPA